MTMWTKKDSSIGFQRRKENKLGIDKKVTSKTNFQFPTT